MIQVLFLYRSVHYPVRFAHAYFTFIRSFKFASM
jgi:hypothetical protein